MAPRTVSKTNIAPNPRLTFMTYQLERMGAAESIETSVVEKSGNLVNLPTSSPASMKGSAASGCSVPICNLGRCTLRTHLNYKRPPALLRQGCQPLEKVRSTARLPHEVYSPGTLHNEHPGTLSEGSNVLSALPIHGEAFRCAKVWPDITLLFSRFFDQHYDDFVDVLYSPKSMSLPSKQDSLEFAFREPLYCLALIALSHFYEIKEKLSLHNRGTHLTCLLYTKLLQQCREILDSYHQPTKTLVVLVSFAIGVLCLFDLSTGREEHLRIHRQGLTALSSRIGGYHNLGSSLSFVLWIDRSMAIFLSEWPLFSGPDPPADALSYNVEALCGVGFDEIHLLPVVRTDVLSACRDTAGLVNLYETKMIAELPVLFSEPNILSSASMSDNHMYFLRDNIDYRLTSLIVCSRGFDLLEECVVLAAKIVQNAVAFANYLPINNFYLSECIWERLSASIDENTYEDPENDWHRFEDILLWTLFACAISCAEGSGHRTRVERLIGKVAKSYFGTRISWLDNSKPATVFAAETSGHGPADVWLVLCRFVWCSSLNSRFIETCGRIPD